MLNPGYAGVEVPRDLHQHLGRGLRELLDRVELSGLLVQADALHANRPFSSTSSSVEPTS